MEQESPPQEEFGDVCFHALGIIDQNREYLQMHLRESGDAPTRQALADMVILLQKCLNCVRMRFNKIISCDHNSGN